MPKRHGPGSALLCGALLCGAQLCGGPFWLTAAQAAERLPRTNYLLHCSGCHGGEGSGAPSAGIPDFRNFVGVFAGSVDGRKYLLHVPGVTNASLSDAEVAAVMNYVLATWGGTSLAADYQPFSPDEISQSRRAVVNDVVALRRSVVDHLHSQGVVAADYPWP